MRSLLSPTATLCVALLAAMGCTDGEVRKDALPERPRPSLRLMVITDLAGTLEPCGCTSRPLGGIDRLAAAVDEVRGAGVPTLFVHAGDLFFGPGPHGSEGEAPTQEVWKAETVGRVLGEIGLEAAAPGHRDLSQGTEVFAPLAREARFPLVGAGVHAAAGSPDDGPEAADEALALQGGLLHRVGGRRIGVIGVMAPDPAHGWPEGFDGPDDPLQAGAEAAQRLRAQGADAVVALVHGSRRLARDAARKLPLDFVVAGGLSEADPIAPVEAGDAVVLHAGRHGQGLLVVDVWLRGRGPWRDVGELGRQARRERLQARIRELRARIATWEGDEAVSEDDVAAQRARLEGMERELQGLGQAAPLPEGNVVAARYRELPPEAPRSERVRGALEAFFRKVNEHNRRVYADAEPPPVPEGEAGYVGSEACASCHASEHDWWTGTPHGRAYATLVERHKQFNLDCVGCHVTGYGEPGGATVTHVESLKNVGCESCHGPGSAHVENPEAERQFVRTEVPEPVCVQCHNPEHSDLFDYDAYRNVLIMPGHGLPGEPASAKE